jgi:hypothetical protein
MPWRHVEAFKKTAGRFQVWILVRRGNPKSLQWIGKPGYIPKMLDCKAKTAERDCGQYRTAGLVVSPILLPHAFSPKKRHKALEEWERFAPRLYTFNPNTSYADDSAGKHYTVQMDKTNEHYGCVMYKPVFVSPAEYIHADYDLYAVVPRSRPKANIRAKPEKWFGDFNHTRSPMFFDVQYSLKAFGVLPKQEFGSPMVRHGEQETFKTDWDDILDVFWPDGQNVSELNGAGKIQEFYANTLRGREQWTDKTVGQRPGGNWEQT